MTCRIGVDPRAVGPGLIVELRSAQGEHSSLGFVQVDHPKVKVKLHRRRRVRPGRRLMTGRSLERQMEACLFALANRAPVCVGEDDGPPREPAVELSELGGIAAFQGDSAQPADTAHSLQASRRRPPVPPACVKPANTCHVPQRVIAAVPDPHPPGISTQQVLAGRSAPNQLRIVQGSCPRCSHSSIRWPSGSWSRANLPCPSASGPTVTGEVSTAAACSEATIESSSSTR